MKSEGRRDRVRFLFVYSCVCEKQYPHNSNQVTRDYCNTYAPRAIRSYFGKQHPSVLTTTLCHIHISSWMFCFRLKHWKPMWTAKSANWLATQLPVLFCFLHLKMRIMTWRNFCSSTLGPIQMLIFWSKENLQLCSIMSWSIVQCKISVVFWIFKCGMAPTHYAPYGAQCRLDRRELVLL